MFSVSKPLYKPLAGDNAIRFIRLLPGAPEDQLALDLVYDNLSPDSLPVYEATSYTWGAPTPTRTITCNGMPFDLRENAYHFLLQLRQPHGSRLLWMDCICINQDDTTERAEQVKIMHLIYRQAKKVIIWLGPGDDLSDIAMDYISKLDSRPFMSQVEHQAFSSGRPAWEAKSFLFDDLVEGEASKQLVQALVSVFSRLWFKRVWVQQEAALCKDTVALCGPLQVSWDQLSSMAWLLMPRDSNGWPSWAGDFSRTIEPATLAVRLMQSNRIAHLRVVSPWSVTEAPDRATFQTDEEKLIFDGTSSTRPGAYLGVPFVKLVGDCSWCEATDPRDKVFALYNLDRKTDPLYLSRRPKIDYDTPWQTIFIRTAKWMYESYPRETLEKCGRSRQNGVNIPSWVPDFRVNLDIAFVLHPTWGAGGAAYNPTLRFLTVARSKHGANSIPSYTYKDNQDRTKRIPNEALELTAILQDRIVHSSPKLMTESEYESQHLRDNVDNILHKLSSDQACIEEHCPTYFTGEPGTEAYAGTIIANTTHEDSNASKDYEINGFAEWHAWLKNGFPDPVPPFHDAVENAEMLTKNGFNITAHGLMCLAPAMATIGDYVAILNGFKYPVALRKVGLPEQQYYELLGPCYIHRMMRGRAWSLIEEFKCKYQPEDTESTQGTERKDLDESPCETFPFNAKKDYREVVRVLGKRRIALV